MENNIIDKLKTPLEKLYWRFLERRSEEMVENGMTGRLVIDFQKGRINSLQDQGIIAGASIVSFGLSKFD